MPNAAILRPLGLALAGVLLSLGAFAAKPAESTGTLDGKLTDWHSVPLSQATVIVRNLSTGATVRGVTRENGSYRFTNLGPGEYRLEADVPALGKGAVDGILISAGHATRVQAALVMQLALPPESPEDTLHELDPVAAAVTAILPMEELNSVPAATRDWQAFAALTPASNPRQGGQGGGRGGSQIGVQPDADAHQEPLAPALSIEGPAGFESAVSIDGLPAASGFHSPSGRESRATESVGPSAVQSMQARTGNAPAEAGQTPGGVLSLLTGHGENALHGQAFYLNRQSLWGAQNPFTQRMVQTAPASGIQIAQFTPEPYTPPNDRQSFGLGAGGKIERDKLFWFAALDGLLDNDPAVATVRHPAEFFARPSDPQLQVFAALLNLPSADPVDEAVSAYSADLAQLNGLLGPVPRSAADYQAFARIDWQIADRHHLSAEAQYATEDAPAGALSRSSETYGNHSFGNAQASANWLQARWDSFLTPNLLNTVAAQFRRSVQSETAQTPSDFEKPFANNAFSQAPEIVADSKYGFILGKPARIGGSHNPDEQAFAAQETLSWVRGAHLIKAGFSFDHIFDRVDNLVNQTGTYSYADALNFLIDESSYLAYGFPSAGNGSLQQANCDGSANIHQFQDGTFSAIGPFPCYAWFSQRIGPSNWHLSTNDLAAFATEQWQPAANLTLSAALRVEAEQLPAPIASVANSGLPATEKLPGTQFNFGPRVGLAWSPFSQSLGKGTVIRLGAGLYFGRIDNSTVLAALTQTGSPNADLNFFFKPADTGAPPFPYVFSGSPQTAVTPGAVAFAPRFRAQQVDQAVVSLEQNLPGHWLVAGSGLFSLGRRLPISIDTNLKQPTDPVTGKPQTITYDVVDALGAGPIKSATITAPFYAVTPFDTSIENARPNTSYQQTSAIESRANSTYEGFLFKAARYGGHGLSLHAHYLYAHATDWNPNESGNVAVDDVLDPSDFRLEYGTSNLDMRHSAGATVLYSAPWKLRDWAGYFANGWAVAAVGQYRSGLPFTMRSGGYIPGYYLPLAAGGSTLIEGVATGINGSGGDNRIYGVAGANTVLNIGRNTYRYPATWTADTRLAKRFQFAHSREIELLAESFNLFNHQNVTLIETTGYTIERGSTTGGKPTFNFMSGLTKSGAASTTTVEFGKPLDVNATNFYRPREIQLGMRARF